MRKKYFVMISFLLPGCVLANDGEQPKEETLLPVPEVTPDPPPPVQDLTAPYGTSCYADLWYIPKRWALETCP
jgi:hypothetical protein